MSCIYYKRQNIKAQPILGMYNLETEGCKSVKVMNISVKVMNVSVKVMSVSVKVMNVLVKIMRVFQLRRWVF